MVQNDVTSNDKIIAEIRPAYRIAYLDSLRGLAALEIAVFFHYRHFAQPFQPGGLPWREAFWFNGLFGRLVSYLDTGAVDLFFALSGIVFCHVYWDSLRAHRVSPREFFILRFSRLYPIHIATLLLLVVLIFPFHWLFGRFPIYQLNDLYSFVINLLFLQRGFIDNGYSFNGPAWSLSVEAFLYLLFFVITWFRLGYAAFLAMLVAGLAIFFSGVDVRFLLNVDVARGLIGFSMGAFLYRYLYRDRNYGQCLLVVCLVTAMTFAHAIGKLALPIRPIWPAAIALFLMLERWPLLQRPLLVRPLMALGDASLAVYMLHVPIQIMIIFAFALLGESVPLERFWFLPVYTTVVLFLGLTVHHVFERPARSWLRRHLLSIS